MTLIVGILCQDGTVLATDSAATMGANGIQTIGQQWVKKLVQLDQRTLFAATGAIGVSQLIADAIKRMSANRELGGNKTPEQVMHEVGQKIAALIKPYFELAQIQRTLTGDANGTLCKTILTVPVRRETCLFTFDFNGTPERVVPELPFVALGSGQMIADPFLAFLKRTFWSESQPTVAEGRLVAVWAIDHVCRVNPGGVGGDVQLATLQNEQVTFAGEEEVQEHRQKVGEAERSLVDVVRNNRAAHPEPRELPAIPAPGGGNAAVARGA